MSELIIDNSINQSTNQPACDCVQGDYHPNHIVIQWFWRVVLSFSNEMRWAFYQRKFTGMKQGFMRIFSGIKQGFMEKIDKDKINKKLSILKGDGGDVLFDEGGGGRPSFLVQIFQFFGCTPN